MIVTARIHSPERVRRGHLLQLNRDDESQSNTEGAVVKNR